MDVNLRESINQGIPDVILLARKHDFLHGMDVLMLRAAAQKNYVFDVVIRC